MFLLKNTRKKCFEVIDVFFMDLINLMINLYYKLDMIYNHHGNTPLILCYEGVSRMVYQEKKQNILNVDVTIL